ncbi:MAG: hypothetical protein GZ090_12085 [Oxalobacteraceae bacterium]|nr:hypothetical protein [Oxalobacteraceae bacterium]
MSSASLYAKYLSELAENFSNEVLGSVAHRDVIDRFGLVAEQFGITPSICVHRGSVLSLCAICSGDDYESKTSALIQAGYEVGNLVDNLLTSGPNQQWEVSVSGHEIDFKLFFTTKKAYP